MRVLSGVRTIIISDKIRKIMQSRANSILKEGTRLEDGTWMIPIGTDTWDRLQRFRIPGEDINDCLERLFALADTKGKLQ